MIDGSTASPRSRPGFTLIESVLVLLVLLALVSILFFFSRSWRRSSERTLCVISQYQVQQAVRGYANLHGKEEGEEVPGLAFLIFGEGKYVEKVPLCPSGGVYAFGGDEVPLKGKLYMRCSLADEDGHASEDLTGW